MTGFSEHSISEPLYESPADAVLARQAYADLVELEQVRLEQLQVKFMAANHDTPAATGAYSGIGESQGIIDDLDGCMRAVWDRDRDVIAGLAHAERTRQRRLERATDPGLVSDSPLTGVMDTYDTLQFLHTVSAGSYEALQNATGSGWRYAHDRTERAFEYGRQQQRFPGVRSYKAKLAVRESDDGLMEAELHAIPSDIQVTEFSDGWRSIGPTQVRRAIFKPDGGVDDAVCIWGSALQFVGGTAGDNAPIYRPDIQDNDAVVTELTLSGLEIVCTAVKSVQRHIVLGDS